MVGNIYSIVVPNHFVRIYISLLIITLKVNAPSRTLEVVVTQVFRENCGRRYCDMQPQLMSAVA